MSRPRQHPKGRGRPKERDIPPRDELEGKSLAEIAEEHGVSVHTAQDYKKVRGIADTNRQAAGSSSDLGQKLLNTDPSEVFDGD